MIHVGLPGGRCNLCGAVIDNHSRGRECPSWPDMRCGRCRSPQPRRSDSRADAHRDGPENTDHPEVKS